MKAIIQREVQSYFTTMVGYIFMAVCMLVCGVFFTDSNIIGGSASFTGVVSSVSYALILITPILTMRSFAEERKTKSDQLLLTAPISVTRIVVGKYISAMVVLLITLAVTLVFPISLFIFGQPYIGEIVLGYIGMIFLGGTFITIGLFISSITENQLTASIVTLGILFLLWLSDSLIPFADQRNAVQDTDVAVPVFAVLELHHRGFEYSGNRILPVPQLPLPVLHG